MHFTYQEPEGDLQQGDVLAINGQVKDLLNRFYPYYSSHRDYRHLMVLTHSCDLARHNNQPCKARYITLAAVRPLETVLNREIKKHQRSSVEIGGGLCSMDRRRWIEDFLAKLLNNNNPEYFYLAADTECHLHEPCVAFLKLGVPVKSEDHYEVCLAARIAQLQDIFQAKLGWLVGNIYSRVGTPDWVPTKATEEEFSKLIDAMLARMCVWVDQSVLSRLQRELKDRRRTRGAEYDMSQDEIIQLIGEYAHEEETRTEKNIALLVERIQQAIPTLDATELDTFRKQLMFNEEIRRFLK